MSYEQYSVVDCDGHIVESIPEMAEFMNERVKSHALHPGRNHQGVFPSLEGLRMAAFSVRPCGKDFDSKDQPQMHFVDYFKNGRILNGCEGSEKSLAYVAKRVGIESFANASDYPHEVDLLDAKHEIEEIAERGDLSKEEKQTVLADNARRFFNL